MSVALAAGIAKIANILFNMVQIIVIASVLIGWLSADPRNPIVQMIQRITEPMYRPFRRITKGIPGPIDWAPMIIILIVIFLQTVMNYWLQGFIRSGT